MRTIANIFSLYGQIFVDNEKANKGIDDTTSKAKKQSSSFSNTLGTIGKGITSVAVGAVTAGAAIVTGFTAAANKTGEYAGTILDASRKTSLSTDVLQEFKYAGEQAGVSFEKLVGSTAKFNKTFSDAATGTGKGVEAFKNLGISLTDIDGKARSSSDVFQDTISKLAEMGDTAEMNALGNQIFGKSFAELKPLLAEGAGGIDALRQKAQDLGIVMSESAIVAGDNFSDTFASLQQAFGGVANQLMGALIPVIQPLLDMIIANMPMITGLVNQLAPVLTQMITTLIPPLMSLAQQLFPIIINAVTLLMPMFSSLFSQLIPPLMEVITAIMPILIDLITTLLPPIMEIVIALLPVLLQIIQMLLPPLIQIIKALLPALMPIIQALIPLLQPILNVLTFMINTVLLPIIGIITALINLVGTQLANVFKALTPVLNGVATVFKNVFSSLMGFVKPPINFIISGINTFIKGINKIKIPDWVPGVGGKGLNLPTIPKLKRGLEYVPYDDFPALLHRGEKVMTARENKEQQEGKYKNNTINNNFNISKIEVRDDKDIRRIAEELFYLQRRVKA